MILRSGKHVKKDTRNANSTASRKRFHLSHPESYEIQPNRNKKPKSDYIKYLGDNENDDEKNEDEKKNDRVDKFDEEEVDESEDDIDTNDPEADDDECKDPDSKLTAEQKHTSPEIKRKIEYLMETVNQPIQLLPFSVRSSRLLAAHVEKTAKEEEKKTNGSDEETTIESDTADIQKESKEGKEFKQGKGVKEEPVDHQLLELFDTLCKKYDKDMKVGIRMYKDHHSQCVFGKLLFGHKQVVLDQLHFLVTFRTEVYDNYAKLDKIVTECALRLSIADNNIVEARQQLTHYVGHCI